jgi:hypothetical protein
VHAAEQVLDGDRGVVDLVGTMAAVPDLVDDGGTRLDPASAGDRALLSVAEVAYDRTFLACDRPNSACAAVANTRRMTSAVIVIF